MASRWTSKEVEILKQNYSRGDLTIGGVSAMVARTPGGVARKAFLLGLYKKWNNEEKAKLERWWGNPAVSIAEICRRLKRDKNSVLKQVYSQGLKRPHEINRAHPWTEQEIEILKSTVENPTAMILELLPNKSEKQIHYMSIKLGLPPRPYGVRFAEANHRFAERKKLITPSSSCFVAGCVGWNDVLEVHHERDGTPFVICAGHHARITRRKAVIKDGHYILI